MKNVITKTSRTTNFLSRDLPAAMDQGFASIVHCVQLDQRNIQYRQG